MPAPDERPNILLIMTDQQRGDCLSADGHPALMTPNMDGIANNGVRFTSAFSTCPSCIAARRSLLSGQFPATHGMVGYRDGVEWDAPPTLPGVLRQAGYETVHVGRSMHQHPKRKRYGFDRMVLAGMGDSDYGEWLAENAPPGSGGWHGGGVKYNDFTAKPWHLPEHMHPTNWTVERALEAMRKRDPSCPLFLTVSFLAPHPPLQPPAFYMERYLRVGGPTPAIGEWAEPPGGDGFGPSVSPKRVRLEGEMLASARAAYYGLINHVDDQIRRLLDSTNREDGITARNTVVLFTADHGEMMGDHYFWRKALPYQGAARIPLLVQAPPEWGLKAGSTVDAPVCLEDVMPTLLDLAGVEAPPTVEGSSLVPLMRGESVQWRGGLHIEHSPLFHAMTDGKEKYVWLAQDGAEQFFDLSGDPKELKNLAGDASRQGAVARWRRTLVEELEGRPEGFTDGERLVPGSPYPSAMPHAGKA